VGDTEGAFRRDFFCFDAAMREPDREQLRAVFNEDTQRYDRIRPGYPMELFVDLETLAGIGPGSRVLDIGCGTGQLTLPLAEHGCVIVALDIGGEMAALTRRKLAQHPSASVHVAAFEDWPLPSQPFDAVVSATAFHWLDPTVRVRKAAQALRPGGALATIATHHIAGGDERFFLEVQKCYVKWNPATPARPRLPSADDVPLDSEELDRSGLFGAALFRRYEWEQTYATAAYRELLLTYSDHRSLAAEARQGLLACIASVLDSRYGGMIAKRYLTELRIARRLPAVGPFPPPKA
jgi:ubiquinone/menaquinone biosynthesis C-methylase UbiE